MRNIKHPYRLFLTTLMTKQMESYLFVTFKGSRIRMVIASLMQQYTPELENMVPLT